jgi:hypothetical protein
VIGRSRISSSRCAIRSSGAYARAASAPTSRPNVLFALYRGIVEGGISQVMSGRLGAEQASAAITEVFLTGTLRDAP